jgi:hypothetical protein
MTVSNIDYRAGPYHSGSDEGQNIFNFYFKVFFKEDVRVVLKSTLGVESDLVLDTDYSVTMNGDQDNNPGGYVTTTDSYPYDAVRTITVVSNIPELQGTALPNGGQWNPRVVENGLDKAMLIPHQLHGFMDRCIRVPISEEDLPVVELPSKEFRANTSIGFDENGDLICTSGFLPGEVIVSAFGEALVGSADADAAQDQLGFTAFTKTLIPAASADAFLDLLGAGTAGKAVFATEDIADIATALGITPFMATLLDDPDPSTAFATLGFSAFGEAWVQAPDIGTALSGVFGTFGEDMAATETLGDAQTLLDISAAGAALINDADADTQLVTLGGGAAGIDVFKSATAADILTALGISGVLAPRGHISGLALSNSAGDPTNDIDIAVGEATDVDQNAVATFASAYTKQLDATWALGSGAGMRDSGAIADGTWHIFLIRRSDTGVTDVLASQNPTSPTMPASYDQKRRIGSILREAGVIVPFVQIGEKFFRTTPVLDVDTTNPGVARVTPTLSVPTGIILEAFGSFVLERGGGDSNLTINPTFVTDAAPSDTVSPLAVATADTAGNTEAGRWAALTNSSRQVAYRVSFSDGTTVVRMTTEGWIDARGKHD